MSGFLLIIIAVALFVYGLKAAEEKNKWYRQNPYRKQSPYKKNPYRKQSPYKKNSY